MTAATDWTRPALAARGSVASLFAGHAALRPDAVALDDGRTARTYGALRDRVARLAAVLQDRGVQPGERIAVLSRNRPEVLEAYLAAAWCGAVVACLNWRMSPDELGHALDLVSPRLVLGTDDLLGTLGDRAEPRLAFGAPLEAAIAGAAPLARPLDLDPESPLLILYTSGTTGRPKGAVISHRALIARNLVTRAELGLPPAAAFVAWSPMYHMGGAEYSLGTLMSGGAVVVVDGYDEDRLLACIRDRRLGWLLLMPGMVGRLADRLEAEGVRPRGVTVCGVMADLVPRADLARITRLLGAPYVDTFGATETGNPPASAGLVPIGAAPARLPKVQSAFCEVKLVDADDAEVPDGTPGELCMRGPTLFSGYWGDAAATARAFRGGWFHMGDVFVRNADGTLEFVDRRKYMIKSGGENIYPAELERVLLSHPDVAEAAVVRQPDARWGEVPVAFVARTRPDLSADELRALCRDRLASYKKPRDIHFIGVDAFPRSASGKVQRHHLEARLAAPERP